MINVTATINAFINQEIDFYTLRQTLEGAINTNVPHFSISTIINNPALIKNLSDSEYKEIIQLFEKNNSNDNDVTIIANATDNSDASNDKTILATSHDDETVLEDKTELANSNTDSTNDNDKTILAPTDNVDDKTVIASRPNNDKTVVDNDKTQIQSKDSSIDADATIAIPRPTSNLNQNIDSSNKKLEPGRIINNRFVLESLLGQGGMGSVFKARDLRKEEAQDSNSHIAIKFLNDDFKQHPQALMSLQREAKKSQTLAHPNIITVHDFDRDGDTVYMTMELLDGAPLDEYLLEHKHTGIKKETALSIIDDMSRALSYAHQKHIVHSDFKPGNVFVTKDGVAKVLDFGIARAVKNIGDKSESEKTLFDAGDLGGLTPSYASCEMLEGKEPSPSDDMYALACVAYELLTGAHPFEKTPATRARNRGLIPKVIKQLDKKQSNALLHALQFSKVLRTPNAQAFNEEFFIRKQSSKGLITSLAIAALLLMAVGAKYFIDYQQQISIDEMVANIKEGNSTAIANAIPELQSLEGETRETVLTEIRPMVVQYYANKSLPLADQAKGKYAFPAALSILAEAKKLYPDSAQLNDLIVQLINSQNQLLNTLALQIDRYLQKGKLTSAVHNNDIQDIIDLLKIAAPESHLLKDQRIQLAYVRELKNAIKKNELKDANILIKSALTLFENDKEILALKNNIKSREAQIVEDQQLVSLQKQLVEKGKKISEPVRMKALKRNTEILSQLINDGFTHASWPNDIQSAIVALDVFSRNKSDKQLKLRAKAATLIVQKAKKVRRSGDLTEARTLLAQANKITPGLSLYKKEQRAIKIAERKQQKTLKSRELSAKIAALKETLLDQAANNDVKKATKTFNALKRINPKSRFVKTDAREAIANAYLRLAKRFAKRKEFSNAVKLSKAGIKIAPRYLAVKNAKNQYSAEIAMIKLNKGLSNIETINVKTSKKQLRQIKLGLPDQFDAYEIEASNIFLKRIKTLAQTNQGSAKKIIDKALLIFPNNPEITALTKRSSKFQSAGGQPCKMSYAGHGRRTRATCFDMLTSKIKAPLMIVIPAKSTTKKAFAISKYEVSIAEYNQYCRLSKRCKVANKVDPKLPKTNISRKSINNYLSWLSKKTKKKYRLPTDSEWVYAANAKGKNSKNDINCRLMLGNKQIKGNNLLNTKSGRQNGWGLKNYIGNVQELVTHKQKLYVRGGAHTDNATQCSIKLKRAHSGKADPITGFRMIKVL